QEDVLSFDVLEGDVRGVWQTLRTILCSVETRVGDLLENAVFEFIAQPLDLFVAVVFLRETARRTERNDVRHGKRSRAATLLLRTADDKRRQRDPVSQV